MGGERIFERGTLKIPLVSSCYSVSGSGNFLFVFVVSEIVW